MSNFKFSPPKIIKQHYPAQLSGGGEGVIAKNIHLCKRNNNLCVLCSKKRRRRSGVKIIMVFTITYYLKICERKRVFAKNELIIKNIFVLLNFFKQPIQKDFVNGFTC